MQSSSQANQASKQESRQGYGQQQQESRQSYGQQQQQSRQNYADNYDDYHHGGGYYPSTAGAYAAGVVTGAVVGSAITAASYNAMSAPKTTVVVGGVTYYQVGSTWYQPVYQGSSVTYIVVNPPK
jgi:hypothetical protein